MDAVGLIVAGHHGGIGDVDVEAQAVERGQRRERLDALLHQSDRVVRVRRDVEPAEWTPSDRSKL